MRRRARGWGGGCEGGLGGAAASDDGGAEEGVPARCEEVAFVVAHAGACVLDIGFIRVVRGEGWGMVGSGTGDGEGVGALFSLFVWRGVGL